MARRQRSRGEFIPAEESYGRRKCLRGDLPVVMGNRWDEPYAGEWRLRDQEWVYWVDGTIWPGKCILTQSLRVRES